MYDLWSKMRLGYECEDALAKAVDEEEVIVDTAGYPISDGNAD